MAMNGTITLVDNRGKGDITNPTIAEGTTVKDVIYAAAGAAVDPDKIMVTVGGVNVEDFSEAVLKNKDFVVVSPKNIKGNS